MKISLAINQKNAPHISGDSSCGPDTNKISLSKYFKCKSRVNIFQIESIANFVWNSDDQKA